MKRVTTIAALRGAVAAARARGERVGLVPTMGALHGGHLSLVEAARRDSGFVVVSVFVNPLQFGPGEDLDAYPRDLDADEALLRGLDDAAPDVVFAPTVDEVYPRPVRTTVTVAGLTNRMCGASRPGHFDGVTTVVSKLFNLVQPDVAFFGRKDFQQLQVIRRMVADLDIPVEVIGCPIVREDDGLAMSSRNRYLDASHRTAALALSRALRAAVVAARDARSDGQSPDSQVLRAVVAGTLAPETQVVTDYAEVLDPETLSDPGTHPDHGSTSPGRSSGEAEGEADDTGVTDATNAQRWLVAVAAQVGPARLIDNVEIGDVDDEDRLLAATAAGSPSG